MKVTNDYLSKKVSDFGADSLTDYELFTFIMQAVLTNNQAERVVSQYFDEYPDLTHLRYFNAYMRKNLFKNTSVSLLMDAICEFSTRYQQKSKVELGQITSSKAIGEYMASRLRYLNQEVMMGLFLDTKNRVIHEEMVFKGTLNSATVHPREIFNAAIRYSSARFMVVHNHPSGEVDPSQNDIKMTKRLESCGKIIGIELLDHIIVGDGVYLSMREQNII